MIQNISILAGVALTTLMVLLPRVSQAPLWRATVTPLASIMGSGFLVPSLLAALRAHRTDRPLTQTALYVALALLGLVIAIFGVPVE